MSVVTLPHLRRMRGPPLLAVWLGLVVGSWILAYLVLRGVICLAHLVLALQ
jgi:hypothetical protein